MKVGSISYIYKRYIVHCGLTMLFYKCNKKIPMSCLNYGSRQYISKNALPNSNQWQAVDSGLYNLIPDITTTYGTPDAQSLYVKDWCTNSSAAYKGTTFAPCGWQSNDDITKVFPSCCVTSWNQQNKSKCCDPVSNDLTNDAIQCDPNWCPFSPECINDPVTASYCQNNPTDNNCKSTCLQYVQNPDSAPSWCAAFIPNYCKAKSPNGQNLSPDDQTLCACSMHKTAADECLVNTCVNAASGSTWITTAQRQNQKDATYCYKQCQNIAQSVANESSFLNGVTFRELCSEVTLPPPSIPLSELPSNQAMPTTSFWDNFSWSSIKNFFTSLTTTEWIIIGVVLFVIFVSFMTSKLMAWTKEQSYLSQ